MELVIFIGIQASGKSSFFKERFFDSHIRVNLDMVRTRNRESMLFNTCLQAKQSMVIDNTNPTPADRARYIGPARQAGFRVMGYYFQSRIQDCLNRNEQRNADSVVPIPCILATHKTLELPSMREGFDRLYYVRLMANAGFKVEEWVDEV